MARPQRSRRICQEPACVCFLPAGREDAGTVRLSLDEYEVLRLVDYEKKTHEQCAARMDISRSTVTEIYEHARYKLADSVINGKGLIITGGNYRLCDGSAACGGERCSGNPHYSFRQETQGKIIFDGKGNITMRIAVTYENGEIFQHFGHAEQFKFYDIVDKKVVYEQVVDTNGSGHGALAGFLAENKVDALICGGIGGGAQVALMEAGILLFGGCRGNADEAVAALLAGALYYDPHVRCDHHDHGEGGCGHHGGGCGHHGGGCGEHGCH